MKTNKKASQLLAWSLASCALFISHSNFCAAEALGQSGIGHESDLDLIDAIRRGNEEEVGKLLDAGADLDQRTKDRFANTPLLEAAVFGTEDIIKRLLNAGADPNQTDSRGITPLMRAAYIDREGAAKLLLNAGADPNQTDSRGETRAIDGAILSGSESMLKLLLEAGADPNQVNRWNQTPLSEAAAKGHEDMVKLLLWSGARLDSLPEEERKQEYAKIVREREQAIQKSLDTQAEQQTGYATGGHGFPTALRGLVKEFEGSKKAKAQ